VTDTVAVSWRSSPDRPVDLRQVVPDLVADLEGGRARLLRRRGDLDQRVLRPLGPHHHRQRARPPARDDRHAHLALGGIATQQSIDAVDDGRSVHGRRLRGRRDRETRDRQADRDRHEARAPAPGVSHAPSVTVIIRRGSRCLRNDRSVGRDAAARASQAPKASTPRMPHARLMSRRLRKPSRSRTSPRATPGPPRPQIDIDVGAAHELSRPCLERHNEDACWHHAVFFP
jgi:hypothetical protein